MMNTAIKFAFLSGAALVLVSGPLLTSAWADSGKQKSHGHKSSEMDHEGEYEAEHRSGSHSVHHGGQDDGTTLIRIGDDDRLVLKRYIEDHEKKNCPPGLAKKQNGCQPPGLAKKSYRVGDRLGDDVVFYPIPSDVLSHLRPAPSGYKYVRVDTDVLLIGEASKKIIDAVTLLSGVGKQ